ncbi:MAG: lactoylglutathione lyase [Methylophaga sp.]|nr:lactoylglutathione lyase [Methylophaga sp.]
MSRHFEHAPGLSEQHDAATHEYVFNQTMLRIKAPERSLRFYSEVMGMTLVKRLDFPEMAFSLYFMAAISPSDRKNWSDNTDVRIEQTFGRPALLELTHNWGDEDKADFSYHNGNSEPRGFGHIGFAVPDVDAACARFESLGIPFVKKPHDGKMKGIAFIQDPDGYWIEIFTPSQLPAMLKAHVAD